MNISGNTKVLAVIGRPAYHSLSPKIHNFLSEKLGMDYVYTAFEPDSMKHAADAIRSLGIKGVNVTAPFKVEAMEAVDVLSENAALSGSVNTIVNEDGILTGYSTDGEGLYASMDRAGISIENKKILVLGGGGVAKPVCVMLKNKGASEVVIKNRTESKAIEICTDLNKKMNTDIFRTYSKSESFDIIINTTSVGLGTMETPVEDTNLFESASAAVDLIYHPSKTKFLADAEEKGLKILNGLGMLVFQGVIAYEHFTGVKVPDSLSEEVLKLLNE